MLPSHDKAEGVRSCLIKGMIRILRILRPGSTKCPERTKMSRETRRSDHSKDLFTDAKTSLRKENGRVAMADAVRTL